MIGDIHKISLIQDPFDMRYIESIYIMAIKKTFSNGMLYSANLEFRRGDTTARQKIEGTDLVDVFMKVHAFCNNLNK